ncbi:MULTISPECIES: hydroxymethylbilane synthase [Ferrimicrobium]|uniref:Porphobilinogen deaminase n=1 Tax=Ferrimicrobium acidiphilum TaxID=121039 RepID=A0ABV3Y572_9ACTN|nr:hydroxymethylbilane synthase [Ferrimicrobium sp.]
MTGVVRLATRGSELALWQTKWVVSLLPVPTEIVTVETEGDRDQERSLTEIGGQGVFVKEIQRHVLDRRATIAVHSAKDLPSTSVDGLVVGAWLPRANPFDAIVGCTLSELAPRARVGTSSLRRSAQLRALRPDVDIVSLRGNIRTRLTKGKGLDAIFVAAAALERLEIQPPVVEILDARVMMPQVGQGVVAVECRADDREMIQLLSALSDRETELSVLAERSFLRTFGTGCSLPIGAFAEMQDGTIMLSAMVAAPDGTRVLRGSLRGEDPEQLGGLLASDLVERGALALLSASEGKG